MKDRIEEAFYKELGEAINICTPPEVEELLSYFKAGATYQAALQSGGEPDGYVAWHPAKGASIDSCAATKADSEWYLNKGELLDGWKIRPVKLIFLDETKSIAKEGGKG